MWAKDRHHRIVSLLAVNDRISTDRLIDELKVSRETIRRDIVSLEAAGQLRRVHGGVECASQVEHVINQPLKARTEAKRCIALAAVRLIKPGMMIAIDTGTTTLAFASALASVPNVSVITNSIGVAQMLVATNHDAKVVLLGGRIAKVVLPGGRIGGDLTATFGPLTIEEMSRFSPDMAVFSPVAFSASHGATSFHQAVAEFGRTMIQRSSRVVMLADHAKLGATSRVLLCDCSQIDVLVTDRRASKEILDELKAAGVKDILIG